MVDVPHSVHFYVYFKWIVIFSLFYHHSRFYNDEGEVSGHLQQVIGRSHLELILVDFPQPLGVRTLLKLHQQLHHVNNIMCVCVGHYSGRQLRQCILLGQLCFKFLLVGCGYAKRFSLKISPYFHLKDIFFQPRGVYICPHLHENDLSSLKG